MRSLHHVTTLSHSLMAPSTKTLMEIVRPWRIFSRAYYHCAPERKTMVTRQVVTSNANSGLRWTSQARGDEDLTPILEVENNDGYVEDQASESEPWTFQTLDQKNIWVREPVGGPSPSHSTNVTMHQSCIFLKSDNYSSRNNSESSGSESSRHLKARASPASDSSSKRWSTP